MGMHLKAKEEILPKQWQLHPVGKHITSSVMWDTIRQATTAAVLQLFREVIVISSENSIMWGHTRTGGVQRSSPTRRPGTGSYTVITAISEEAASVSRMASAFDVCRIPNDRKIHKTGNRGISGSGNSILDN
jgi:hypothetical protein